MSLVFAQASSTTASLFVERRQRLGRALLPVEREHVVTRSSGSTADTRDVLAAHHAAGEARARRPSPRPASPPRPRPDAGADRREAVGVLEDEVALEVAVDRVAHRGADPGGERRSRTPPPPARSSARAAVTAVRPGLRTAFSRASRPVRPRSFSSGQPIKRGERAHEPRAEQRDAEQRGHRAAADQRRRPRSRRRWRRTGRRRSCRCPSANSSSGERREDPARACGSPAARPPAAPPSASRAWPAAPARAPRPASRRCPPPARPRSCASRSPCRCSAGRSRSS